MNVQYIPDGEVRNHKDTVFVDMFAKDIDAPQNFISLYNALHDTNLKVEDTKLVPMILENVLFEGLGNDVAMEINNKIIVLAEHQSTINENMPIRCLEYITRLFEFKLRGKTKFQQKLIKLATPEFYVFYNGLADYPQEKILKLSSAFIEKSKSTILPLELSVKVININYNKSHPLLKKCKALDDYTAFMEMARKFRLKGSEAPVQNAVEQAIKNGIMPDYLKRRSLEISSMIFGEWDRDEWAEVIREETREDALIEGRTLERKDQITKKLAKNKTPEQISEELELSLEEVNKLIAEIKKI